MINHIMCTSKVSTDLCFTKQKIKTENGFVGVVYSVLVVFSSESVLIRQDIKKIVWVLMVNSQ